MNTDNPFYHNYLFKKEDLERSKIDKPWYIWPWLFLLPTWVQINDGYAFFYKQYGNQYFIVGHESLAQKEKES